MDGVFTFAVYLLCFCVSLTLSECVECVPFLMMRQRNENSPEMETETVSLPTPLKCTCEMMMSTVNRFTHQFLRKYPVKLLQWLGERLEIFISLQWQSRPCHRADECRTGNLAYIWMWAHFYIIAELCLPKYENSSCRLVNHRKCRTIFFSLSLSQICHLFAMINVDWSYHFTGHNFFECVLPTFFPPSTEISPNIS